MSHNTTAELAKSRRLAITMDGAGNQDDVVPPAGAPTPPATIQPIAAWRMEHRVKQTRYAGRRRQWRQAFEKDAGNSDPAVADGLSPTTPIKTGIEKAARSQRKGLVHDRRQAKLPFYKMADAALEESG